jgi:hypothetical protein
MRSACSGGPAPDWSTDATFAAAATRYSPRLQRGVASAQRGAASLPTHVRARARAGGWNTCAIDIVDELRCWGPPKAAGGYSQQCPNPAGREPNKPVEHRRAAAPHP